MGSTIEVLLKMMLAWLTTLTFILEYGTDNAHIQKRALFRNGMRESRDERRETKVGSGR